MVDWTLESVVTFTGSPVAAVFMVMAPSSNSPYKGGKLQGQYLFNFPNCMQGCYPQGTLARDSVGNPYGMAQGGTNSCGGLSCGVVYRLAPQTNGTWKYSVLVNLSETTGGVAVLRTDPRRQRPPVRRHQQLRGVRRRDRVRNQPVAAPFDPKAWILSLTPFL